MTWVTKHDSQGNIIKPGDLCVRCGRSGKPEFCIYVGDAWGGKSSNGDYGRFINADSSFSIKYSNVICVFDPIGDRRSEKGFKEIVRKFYEQGKK